MRRRWLALAWRACPWVALFALAFGERVVLIAKYPPVYWWDAFARIWESDHLIVRDWLPIPQIPVMLVGDIDVLRGVYALVAAGATVTLGIGVARIWDRRHALAFAFLMCLQPLFVKWSIVPYQEAWLLLFVGLALAAFPRGLSDDDAGWIPWLGAAALAAAALCRYEAWWLAVVLAGGAACRKQWRALRYLAPVAVVMAAWLATGSLRDPSMGPPRLVERVSGFDVPFDAMLDMGWEAAKHVTSRIRKELTLVGLALGIAGLLWVAWHGGRSRREIAVFTLGLAGLTVVRSLFALTTTSRMLVFPVMWIGLFAVVAWFAAVDGAFERTRSRAPRWAMYALTAVLAAWVVDGYRERARKIQRSTGAELRPESAVARKLAELPPDTAVAIFPRRMRNILQESAVAAIFANAPELDPRDARWSYEGKDPSAPVAVPDVVFRWNGKRRRYEMIEAPLELRKQVRAHAESQRLRP